MRALVGAGPAQLHTLARDPLAHHLAADLPRLDDLLHPPAVLFHPTALAGRLGAAHHAARAVNSAVQRCPRLVTGHTLDDHADVAHRPADEAALPRPGRRCAF